MAFPTIDRIGVSNFTGTAPATTTAEFANFRKEYLVEVIKRFKEKLIFAQRVMKRQITSGTGASFPLTGKTTAKYHIPGVTADLQGDTGMPQTEKTINVDRVLLSDIMVASIDDIMAHVDVRDERANQQATALARKSDQQLAQLLVLCSRASTIVSGGLTGGSISTASMDTDKDVLVAGITSAVQKFATNDVPIDPAEIGCVLPVAQYFLLLTSDKVINLNYGTGAAGGIVSPFRTGLVPSIAGCPIDWSNNMPSTNITEAEAGELNTYWGDFTKTYGIVFHRSAVGTVQLMDLQFESQWLIQKQSNLFVAKMATGHGYLRPEAAVELCKP